MPSFANTSNVILRGELARRLLDIEDDENEHEKLLAQDFDRALAVRDTGDLAGARTLLLELVLRLTSSDTRLLAHSHMQLGNIAHKLGDAGGRVYHFTEAVKITPKLELASLGLFHALSTQGREKEAFQEMLRFLNAKDSEMYRELLCQGFGESLSAELQAMVTSARELLARHRRS
jgi:predicted Zn-dependent protease